MNNKNVVFYVTTLNIGGIETYLLRFIQNKHLEFNKIIIHIKSGKPGQLDNQFLLFKNVIIHYRKVSFFNIFDYLNVYKLLKINQIDSICDFTGNFAGIIILCAKIANVKNRIAFYRGSNNHFKETRIKLLYNFIVKWLVSTYATNILSNSKAALNFFFPLIWEKDFRYKVIYNGIDSHLFLSSHENLRNDFNIPNNSFVVGHVGRYNYFKNHETIIKVAFELCKNNYDIYFILCGNGVKDNLQSIVDKENLGHKIILFNNRIDIPIILNTLNCFYFPSISEGQPNALIEAMLYDIPIIASNIDPIMEIFPENYLIHLIDPFNVGLAVNKILQFKNNRNYYNSFKFSEYAKLKFNPNENFTFFSKILLN
jgi:glycosyltransferase involved in cell wall biosynthesis